MVDSGGLLSRCTGHTVPWVRIPPSPPPFALRSADGLEPLSSAVLKSHMEPTSHPKVCPGCGALIDLDVAVCPYCGVKGASPVAEKMRRSFGFVMPRWCPVTMILLFVNFANLLAVMVLFGPKQLLAPDAEMLLRMGALNPYLFYAGEHWRLITYGYLHIGLMHIAFNMFSLSQVGTALEEAIGASRLFVVYTLSLIGGGLADVMWRGPAIMNIAGASGALFGLIGFGMSFAHFYGGPVGRAQRNFFLHWAVYGFAFGYLVNADNLCHLGGFVTGALLGYPIERERAFRDRFTPVWRVLAVALAMVTIAAFVWMILVERARL